MSASHGPRLTRRALLRAGGVTALAATALRRPATIEALRTRPLATVTAVGDFDILVTRPLDNLRLSLSFRDCEVVAGELRPLTTVNADPWYSIGFPAQHLAEEDIPAGQVHTPPVASRAARGSRLVFDVDQAIPFELAALLDVSGRSLRLSPRALTVSSGPVVEPPDDVTALVMPEGLWLSPSEANADYAPLPQFTLDDTTEVLVMRQGLRPGLAFLPVPVEMRALWTPGYQSGVPITGTGISAFPLDRFVKKRIVRATSDGSDTTEYPDHEPLLAPRLWLTSAGGWLDIAGAWDGNGQLAAWEHQVRAGRDTYIKIVSRGHLLPFGHPATVIDVTERTFVRVGDVVQTQLETTTYLSLVEGTQVVPGGLMDDAGRGFPFLRAVLADSSLYTITKEQIDNINVDAAFYAHDTGGDPLLLDYALEDRVGGPSTAVSFPAIWVGADSAFNPNSSVVGDLLDWLTDPVSADDRTMDLGGQRVGYTDEDTPGSGRTTFATDWQRWTFELPLDGTTEVDLRGVGFPTILPRLEVASAANPALDALLGRSMTFVEVALDVDWLQFGNQTGDGQNPLLNSLAPISGFDVSFEGLGSGIAGPTFRADTFNQVLGFAPADLLPGGSIDVGDILGDLPTLLGVLDLNQLVDGLVEQIPPVDLPDVPTIPGFQIDLETDVNGIPTKIVATFHWEKALQSQAGVFIVGAEQGGKLTDDDTLLAVDALVCVPLDGGDPESEVSVFVNNFAIQGPPNPTLITVSFHEVRLTARNGEGLELVPDLAEIRFDGVLVLLEALQPLLQFQGGGLELEEQDDVVTALVRVSIPDINVGILAIRNISVAAGANVPLVLGAQFETVFEFGTKSNPVTVLVFGYGGGFHLELTGAPFPGTFDLIRLGINVTFEQSINVVVAKGTLSASFGAYLEVLPNDVVLGAYVEVTGSVKVLGIVTITVGASIELMYSVATMILTGTATIFAEVDTPLGSKEVTFQIEQEIDLGGSNRRKANLSRSRSFGRARGLPPKVPPADRPGGSQGGDGDDTVGTLGDRYDQQAWQAWCDAFGD